MNSDLNPCIGIRNGLLCSAILWAIILYLCV